MMGLTSSHVAINLVGLWTGTFPWYVTSYPGGNSAFYFSC